MPPEPRAGGNAALMVDGPAAAWPDAARRDEPWWLSASAWQQAIEKRGSAATVSAAYRFGDGVLQVVLDDPALAARFADLYGDCALAPAEWPARPLVRCEVRRGGDPPLVLLHFAQGAPRDPATAAIGLLRPPPGHPQYVAGASPLAGWRTVSNSPEPVLATRGPHVLVDPRRLSPEFLIEYLLCATLAAQPGLLVMHAASAVVGSAGLVLVGPSHGGKTTISLHLGARGHTVLGDEMALIRLASTEVLPSRRRVNLRPGPRSTELSAALDRHRGERARPTANPSVESMRIDALFPDAPAHAARLRAAFFLDGFADRPALAPFRLELSDMERFDARANDIAGASWELSPARRALRLVTLRQVLARVPCWLLTVGSPGETAALIERTMEKLAC